MKASRSLSKPWTALAAVSRDASIFACVVVVAGLGLLVESAVTELIWQNLLGLLAGCVLLGLLKNESWSVRIQVAIVVCIATAAEYLFSPHWHFYAYRLDNVPYYVPPGHGMVYLAALALSRDAFFHRHRGRFRMLALSLGSAWAAWNVFFAERSDIGGGLLFVVLFLFTSIGRAYSLYVAAFFMTTYLELVGTALNNWAWAVQWPFFGLSQANPPCGISAGYCIFDAIGVGGAWLIQRIGMLAAERFRDDRLAILLEEAEPSGE